jgi:excisionase family DNA binding protein
MSAKSKAKSLSEVANGPPARVDEVLTSSEAAAFLRVPEKVILQLANAGRLPARKIGTEWRFLKDAIVDWLRQPELATETKKKSMLAVIGSLKDDEMLDAMVEEIYRQRKQNLVEG